MVYLHKKTDKRAILFIPECFERTGGKLLSIIYKRF